jgi:hypothetical protein
MMKQKSLKTHGARKSDEKATIHSSLVIVVSIGVLALVAIIYILFRSPRIDSKSESMGPVQIETPTALKPKAIFDETVRRAYAIDAEFHRVYTAGWEGANGAIGEAHLYAATGNANLLNSVMNLRPLTNMENGTWVDDRAWICLAELYWWQFSGRKNRIWVEDAKKRYDEAKEEGRLSNHEGFWSWYNYSPKQKVDDIIITNSNMNQMVTVACMLYDATREERFYKDAILVWEGDSKYPGIEKTFYRGEGEWMGKQGRAAFGKQLPWDDASYCSVGAAMYRMTGNAKFKKIVAASANRIMDPLNGWIDSQDYYQLRMDGNGAFVHFVLDAYMIAPELLPEIPEKTEKMLEHVWTNHHGEASVTLHRFSDDGIRNGWNPFGGEEGYNVNEVGTVHAQSQAMRAFGVFAYVLHEKLKKE